MTTDTRTETLRECIERGGMGKSRRATARQSREVHTAVRAAGRRTR